MRILSFSLKIMLLALVPFLASTGCKDDEPDKATISGTITIENADLWATWQDSGVVQVALFPEFDLDPFPGAGWGDVPDNYYGPGVPGGRFALGAPSYTVDLTYVPGQTQYNYSLEVEPGTYSALALGFRHNFVSDPALRTATLGVYYNNPNSVSHGIVIRPAIGAPPILDFPAPLIITVDADEDLDLDFRANFAFVNVWFQ